jgi:hydroxymethylpyrimidine pyrophosphatase-like HAD family hydrolase
VPLAAFGLAPPAVLLDGAIGIDLATGHTFHERPIAPGVGRSVLARFRRHGLSPVVYVDSTAIDAYVGPDTSTNPGHLKRFGRHACVADLDEVIETETVLAFGLIGVPEAPLEAVAAAILADRLGEARINPSFDFGDCAFTVVAHGLSKWDGVLAFCAKSGIDAARVLAIGDGSNDVELLAHAALSFSLDGSSALAVEAADHLVGSVSGGGWAEILDFF